ARGDRRAGPADGLHRIPERDRLRADHAHHLASGPARRALRPRDLAAHAAARFCALPRPRRAAHAARCALTPRAPGRWAPFTARASRDPTDFIPRPGVSLVAPSTSRARRSSAPRGGTGNWSQSSNTGLRPSLRARVASSKFFVVMRTNSWVWLSSSIAAARLLVSSPDHIMRLVRWTPWALQPLIASAKSSAAAERAAAGRAARKRPTRATARHRT